MSACRSPTGQHRGANPEGECDAKVGVRQWVANAGRGADCCAQWPDEGFALNRTLLRRAQQSASLQRDVGVLLGQRGARRTVAHRWIWLMLVEWPCNERASVRIAITVYVVQDHIDFLNDPAAGFSLRSRSTQRPRPRPAPPSAAPAKVWVVPGRSLGACPSPRRRRADRTRDRRRSTR